jgi:hypothetical protein
LSFIGVTNTSTVGAGVPIICAQGVLAAGGGLPGGGVFEAPDDKTRKVRSTKSIIKNSQNPLVLTGAAAFPGIAASCCKYFTIMDYILYLCNRILKD